jgi:thiol-disulfide isomerase/thioredoxin
MRSVLFLLLLAASCRTSDPIESDPAAKKQATPSSAEPAKMEIGSKTRGVELVPAPPGDVAEIVKAARTQARAHGRALMVYIGAVWCEPCQRFHHAAEEGKLDDKFPTLSLLVFDLDRDGDRLKRAQYAPGYIPYFGVPGDDGHATSNATEGSIKGEGAIDNITPRLTELVAKAK